MAVLKLTPSSWFYNLSVYGFLRVLMKLLEKEKIEKSFSEIFKEDGTVEIDERFLRKYSIEDFIDGLEELSLIKPFGRQKAYFSNIERTSRSLIQRLKRFLSIELSSIRRRRIRKANCIICLEETIVDNENKLSSGYGNLFPVKKQDFPNNYWAFNTQFYLCGICAGLSYFHIAGFIGLGGRRGIFINTPNFKHIWLLNKHMESLHSQIASESVRTLLGLTFIDLAIDLNLKLGLWQRYATEVVIFENEQVDFYEIDPFVLELLTDKEVASLLRSVGSFRLVKEFVAGNFHWLEILYTRLVRGSKKDEVLREFFKGIMPEDERMKKAKYIARLGALVGAKRRVAV